MQPEPAQAARFRTSCSSQQLGGMGDGKPSHSLHRRRLQKKSHSQRYKIGSPFAVFKNPEQYTAFHALVFHYSVERRLPKCEYPPVGYWIAEDAATFRIDNPFFREQGLYDPRRRIGQRHDVHLLNPSILSLVIPEDISVVLHDLDSWKPFASIVRNFSNSRPMLWWMKRVVDDAVGSRRTARQRSDQHQKEEPGQLVQVGWTTGSRNNSSFDAARNLLRPHEDTTEADKENAFATAYFWRRVQLLHPPEVGNSIAAFYREHNIPLLDPDWPATRRVHRPVSVPTDTEPITFQDAEFAPGCLVMTERDCQCSHTNGQSCGPPSGKAPILEVAISMSLATAYASGWLKTPQSPRSRPTTIPQVLAHMIRTSMRP
ncbi:hypothetical protein BKA70DRAFT_1240499 [Coprinopsis sp. MPI-PUGE-AT-0042]|nr:hypothetical protein BKA70DRAFT_1240499 [Coprinopsis sp. MPI-PUGE-AT-0042]